MPFEKKRRKIFSRRGKPEAEPPPGLSAAEAVQLFLEEFGGGPVAQDFAVHAVETAGNGVTVPLGYISHALAFGKVAADEAVGILVRATFTGGIGVAVEEGGDQSLDAVGVLELRAVVNGDSLEGPR